MYVSAAWIFYGRPVHFSTLQIFFCVLVFV